MTIISNTKKMILDLIVEKKQKVLTKSILAKITIGGDSNLIEREK